MDKKNNKEWTLKLSLTGKCNLKCFYCKDEGVNPKDAKVLSVDDYFEVLEAAKLAGVSKVQWTGGECSLANIDLFSKRAFDLGYKSQALTSNGINLDKSLDNLINYGLSRVNISLDSLDENTYRKITGKNALGQVLNVINKCSEELNLVKVNIATMRENIREVPDFISYARELDGRIVLKFHELWRFQPSDIYESQHVSSGEIFDELSKYGELKKTNLVGNNPSIKYYDLNPLGIKIGIAPVPENWTCGGFSCSKIRVYSTGDTCEGKKLYGTNLDEKVDMFSEIISSRESTFIQR